MTTIIAPNEPNDDLWSAVDAAVSRLLDRMRILAPPVDAAQLRVRFGFKLREPRRGSRAARRFVRDRHEPGKASCRQESQVAAAACIGNHLAGDILARVRISEESLAEARAQIAKSFVARLLMPTDWFREDVRSLGCDVFRLHARYHTATEEAVAWRLLDMELPCVVTVFDNDHIVDRRTNVPIAGLSGELDRAELAAQAYAHHYSRARVEYSSRITARAWPLHRADWRREIVVARLDCESFDIVDYED